MADTAVAHEVDVFADVAGEMNQPRLFGTLQDLPGLLFGDQPGEASIRISLGARAEAHAIILGLVAGTAHQFPVMAAVACSNGYVRGILDVLRYHIVRVNLNPSGDLLLHGNHPGPRESGEHATGTAPG